MTDDRIRTLLQEADRTAGPPVSMPGNLAAAVRRRAGRRRLRYITAPIVATTAILVVLGVGQLGTKPGRPTPDNTEIALLQAEIKQLQARTNAALKLVQEVVESERRQRRLDLLKAELASIPDPLEEIQKKIDDTACTLVYHASRMHTELDRKDSAVRTYNSVIELFPQSHWADVAWRKLSEMQNEPAEKNDSRI